MSLKPRRQPNKTSPTRLRHVKLSPIIPCQFLQMLSPIQSRQDRTTTHTTNQRRLPRRRPKPNTYNSKERTHLRQQDTKPRQLLRHQFNRRRINHRTHHGKPCQTIRSKMSQRQRQKPSQQHIRRPLPTSFQHHRDHTPQGRHNQRNQTYTRQAKLQTELNMYTQNQRSSHKQTFLPILRLIISRPQPLQSRQPRKPRNLPQQVQLLKRPTRRQLIQDNIRKPRKVRQQHNTRNILHTTIHRRQPRRLRSKPRLLQR